MLPVLGHLQFIFNELLQFGCSWVSIIGQLRLLQLGMQLGGLEYHHITVEWNRDRRVSGVEWGHWNGTGQKNG